MLTIGIPVYNGAKFIRQTIESVLAQSFNDFIIIISDNHSVDETSLICNELVNLDDRIIYVHHKENRGAYNNFKYLVDLVETEYFMWLASDDIIHPDFVKSCVGVLQQDSSMGMAFTGMENIDSMGRTIRCYPNLQLFSGGKNFITILKYIISPEIFGKANLIYSIYRANLIKEVINHSCLDESWGSDMAFVLACIARGGIKIIDKVMFYKRHVVTGDDCFMPLTIKVPKSLINQSCPLDKFVEYEGCILRSIKENRYYLFVVFLMRYRYVRLMRASNLKSDQEKKVRIYKDYFDVLCSVVTAIGYSSVHVFDIKFSKPTRG